MNYIPQICEMLGLEWDYYKMQSEEFEIDGVVEKCVLRNEGCFFRDNPYIVRNHFLGDLISGRYSIKQKSWKPKNGEDYYVPAIHFPDYYDCMTWMSHQNDIYRLDNGLVFKTEQEAIAKAKEILEMLKGGK